MLSFEINLKFLFCEPFFIYIFSTTFIWIYALTFRPSFRPSWFNAESHACWWVISARLLLWCYREVALTCGILVCTFFSLSTVIAGDRASYHWKRHSFLTFSFVLFFCCKPFCCCFMFFVTPLRLVIKSTSLFIVSVC